jgi:DNA-binding GntR family transcriptional regulator
MEPIDRTRTSRTTRVEVYETLRASIVSLHRTPGQRLSEAELARDLGVSRTPVREAIIQLRADGLVEVTPQLGSFVSKISLRNVREAQFAREALECAAVRVAAERIDAAATERLRQNVALQRAAQTSADLEQFYRLDEAFHRELVATSGYSGISDLLDRSRAHLNRVRRLSLPVPDVIEELIDQHSAVLEALEHNDADQAEAALRHHLRGVYRVLEPLRDAHPDYFVPSDDGADGYEGEPLLAPSGTVPAKPSPETPVIRHERPTTATIVRDRARTSGARLRHLNLGGLEAISLENDLLRMTFLAGKGAKVVEFLYKPRGIDLASWASSGLTSPASLDQYTDGWWDVFPNGGSPTSYRGADFSEHGEVALLPWDVEILDDTPDEVAIRLSVRAQRYPAYVEKVIRMNAAEPRVHVELSLQNLAPVDLEAMWGCHLAFSKPFLEPGAVLVLEEGARVVPHYAAINESGRRRVDGSKQGRWPTLESMEGTAVDLSVLPAAAASELLYVTDFSNARYEIRQPNGGLAVQVAWDGKTFPYLWLWQEFGDATNYPWWGGVYAVGMEPYSSYGIDGLASAVENGSALRLSPHEVRTSWLKVTVAE